MWWRRLALGVLVMLLAAVCGGGAGSATPADGKALTERAVRLLCSEATKRIEVLWLPKDIESRGPTTPEILEKHFYYRITMQRHGWSKLETDLTSSLARSEVRPAPCWPAASYRWGCILYDAKGKRVLAMYFDSFGKNGIIGGTYVALNGAIVKMLERRCASLWS